MQDRVEKKSAIMGLSRGLDRLGQVSRSELGSRAGEATSVVMGWVLGQEYQARIE